MKRNPRKLGWTKAFRRAHGKEMVIDGALALAAKRNVPTRYNRETVTTALKAMQRYSEIKARRERVFYKDRMKGNRVRQMDEDRKLVAENQHLLPKELRDQAEALLREREEEDEEMKMEGEAEAMEEEEEEDSLEGSEMDSEMESEEEVVLDTKKKPKSILKKKLKMKVGGGFDED